MRTHVAATTHLGLVRARNEDCFGYSLSGAIQDNERLVEVIVEDFPFLAVVADGLGGHPCGDVASRLVVEEMLKAAPSSESQLASAIALAHTELLRQMADQADCAGMGSTVVAALVTTDRVIIANVGDSCVYSLQTQAPLIQLSIDDAPAGAPGSRGGSLITQALGRTRTLAPHITSFDVGEIGRLLLCSDGLSSYVPGIEISDALRADGPRESMTQLRDAALAAGGADNITIVVLDLPEPIDSHNMSIQTDLTERISP